MASEPIELSPMSGPSMALPTSLPVASPYIHASTTQQTGSTQTPFESTTNSSIISIHGSTVPVPSSQPTSAGTVASIQRRFSINGTCTLILTAIGAGWAIKSFQEAAYANQLAMKEACRQHPHNPYLQKSPLCQAMRDIGDYDRTLKRQTPQIASHRSDHLVHVQSLAPILLAMICLASYFAWVVRPIVSYYRSSRHRFIQTHKPKPRLDSQMKTAKYSLDPLSVASKISVALESYTNALQSLGTLSDYGQDFSSLRNQAKEDSMLLRAMELALHRIRDVEQEDTELQGCLSWIHEVVVQIIAVFTIIGHKLQEGNTKNLPTSKQLKREILLYQKQALLHLFSQASTLVTPMRTALSFLQKSNQLHIENQATIKIDLVFSMEEVQVPELPLATPLSVQIRDTLQELKATGHTGISSSTEPSVNTNALRRRRRSRTSKSSDTTAAVESKSLAMNKCELPCRCRCHQTTQHSTSSSKAQGHSHMNMHDNGSMLLRRQSCNEVKCRRGGVAQLWIAYSYPGRTLPLIRTIYLRSEPVNAKISRMNRAVIRTAHDREAVWKAQESGDFDEPISIFADYEASPRYVAASGASLPPHGKYGRIIMAMCALFLPLRTNADGQDSVFWAPRTTNADGWTSLIWAVSLCERGRVESLLKYGVDVNKAAISGLTPLIMACLYGYLDVVKLLLDAGASVTISNLQGYYPIHYASLGHTNGPNILKVILAHGADPNATSDSGNTPLHTAAESGSVPTIKCLLAHGCSINEVNRDGDTPVMRALLCWNEPTFLYLVTRGARLDISRKSGESVVHAAMLRASIDVWEVLREQAMAGKLSGVDTSVLHD